MRRRFRFHRPRRSRQLAAGTVLIGLGVAAAASGFAHATTRSEETTAFANTGTFSYSGTGKPSAAYPGGVARTGAPLVVGAIDRTTFRFTYRFSSRLPHAVGGTVALQELLVGSSGWRNAYKLGRPIRFSGDSAAVSAPLSLRGLAAVIADLGPNTAAGGASYSVRLQSVVRYAGQVDGHEIHGTFAPTLPFTVNPSMLAPSAGSAGLDAELHPVKIEKLPRSVARTLSLGGIAVPVLALRIGGGLLAVLGLLVAVRSQRPRRDVWSHEKRLAHRAGRVLVDVADLEHSAPPGSVVTLVPGFESLVALAVQAGRPILYEPRAGGELYAVDHPPRLYLYRRPPATLRAVPDRGPSEAGGVPTIATDALRPDVG